MSPATLLGHPAQAQAAPAAKAPTLLVPFTRAAKEHEEQFVDVSQALDASSHSMGPFDVAAYGFMRGIMLLVQATGGSGTTTVAAQEDAPWSAIQEIALLDVNGAPIVGPISGYDLYLINKYGGAQIIEDPKLLPSYGAVAVGASATGDFSFSLYLPVEVSARDALASLANQNGASTYKLRITLAADSLIYSTAPTTPPTVRIRAYLDAWTQPTATDLHGNPNAVTPPAHGTTSFWSKTSPTVNAGQQTTRLPRVGNYLRNLIFVFRTAAGSRTSQVANIPDPLALYWDTRLLRNRTFVLWQDEMAKRTGYTAAIETAGGLDHGVAVYDFAHDFDGRIGHELRDGWLPTVQSTRLELQGTWGGGAASSLDIITNDVAPAGQVFV